MYGVLVLAVLLSIGGVFYVRGVDTELSALQARLRIAAAALATSITPEDLASIRTEADIPSAAYQRIARQFRAVAAAEPEFSDIYVFRPGPTAGILEIVVDVVIRADAAAGKPGEPYTPLASMHMLEGFERPTVETEPYTDAWGTVLSGYAPVRAPDGTAVGLVGLDVRATRLAAIKRDVAMLTLTVLAVSVGVLTVLAWIVSHSVRRPLARIVEATNAIASGRLHVRAQLARRDEFGVVGRHFDDMAVGLQEREFIKQTFGQYVSPEVVQQMLLHRSEAVRGQRRHVAVMFVDLRKFTTLSEGMAPEDVVAMLNDYLERMTRVISENGGRVDKFIGDAIMADWGTLDTPGIPEVNAANAGLAMLAELATWNAARAAVGGTPLEIGLAIHAGPVVAGSIGSSQKLEYTIIGDTVNVASRLEGLCKVFGARIVVSGTLVEAAGRRDEARWLDTMKLRGRQEATEVYELLPETDPRRATLDAYDHAAALLRAGDHAGARTAFESLRTRGADPVIDHQLARLAGEADAA